MIRAYIRIVPDVYARKALGESDGKHPPYPPAAFGAYLACLCLAEAQVPRGRFRNRKVLEGALEGSGAGSVYADQVDWLIEHGDLIVNADGSLYVEGWDELQEGDWKVSDRMRRFRERRNPRPDPTEMADSDDPAVAYMQITGSFPRGKTIEWIDDLSSQFGAEATRRALAAASENGTEGLLGRVADALRLAARAAQRREMLEEQERVRRQRSDIHPNVLVSRHLFGAHAERPVAACRACQKAQVPA